MTSSTPTQIWECELTKALHLHTCSTSKPKFEAWQLKHALIKESLSRLLIGQIGTFLEFLHTLYGARTDFCLIFRSFCNNHEYCQLLPKATFSCAGVYSQQKWMVSASIPLLHWAISIVVWNWFCIQMRAPSWQWYHRLINCWNIV